MGASKQLAIGCSGTFLKCTELGLHVQQNTREIYKHVVLNKLLFLDRVS